MELKRGRTTFFGRLRKRGKAGQLRDPPSQCADGVFPRCAYCPLFDAERAIRDVLGENPPPPVALEIQLGPTLRALLRGEPPPAEPEAALGADVPDFLPEEWEEPPRDDAD
jgi:hypothetical protein